MKSIWAICNKCGIGLTDDNYLTHRCGEDDRRVGIAL